MSKLLCLAISHTTNQHPSLQATGQHGAIGSAGTVFVCCPTCTSEKAEGHQPSYSWHTCTSPSKAIRYRPREPDAQISTACVFSGDCQRACSQPQDLPVAGGASCQPHVAAGAAGAGPASRTEAQAMAGCCCRGLRHRGQGEF